MIYFKHPGLSDSQIVIRGFKLDDDKIRVERAFKE